MVKDWSTDSPWVTLSIYRSTLLTYPIHPGSLYRFTDLPFPIYRSTLGHLFDLPFWSTDLPGWVTFSIYLQLFRSTPCSECRGTRLGALTFLFFGVRISPWVYVLFAETILLKKIVWKFSFFLTFFGGRTIFLLNWVGKVLIFFIFPPWGTFGALDFCSELRSCLFCQKWMLQVHSFPTKKFQAKILSEKKVRAFFVSGHRIFEAKNSPCAGPPGLSRALARPPGSWIRATPQLGSVCFFWP